MNSCTVISRLEKALQQKYRFFGLQMLKYLMHPTTLQEVNKHLQPTPERFRPPVSIQDGGGLIYGIS
jgi:hypothetical protein